MLVATALVGVRPCLRLCIILMPFSESARTSNGTQGTVSFLGGGVDMSKSRVAATDWIRLHKVQTILVSILGTALVTTLVLNFAVPEKRIQQVIVHRYGVRDPQFRHELGTLLGPPILDGNSVMQPGERRCRSFPAMLEAIRARGTALPSRRIFIGRARSAALSPMRSPKGPATGVKVHVLLDWLGSQKMDDKLLDEMRSAGVQIERYHPLHWYHLSRLNNRTHRKLLVTDGKVGFTGGVGIADAWTGHAQDPDHWRDSHYRIVGPAVAQMQAASWTTGSRRPATSCRASAISRRSRSAGAMPGQIFTSSPRGGVGQHVADVSDIDRLERAHHRSVGGLFRAGRADSQGPTRCAEARRQDRIITPGKHIDSQVVRKASKESWDALLAAGAHIYEYQPTMFHCKMLIVDAATGVGRLHQFRQSLVSPER